MKPEPKKICILTKIAMIAMVGALAGLFLMPTISGRHHPINQFMMVLLIAMTIASLIRISLLDATRQRVCAERSADRRKIRRNGNFCA